ncbi:hypothetical protein Cni_G20612 [Canna indica]|uniref:Uncharacterized protein n=1 Tax=Canna indica TaxID=4628 RepID=A0AAQ3QJM5_9LILI|nr:hypothetical protein Cni_G20612 [Canna indica]
MAKPNPNPNPKPESGLRLQKSNPTRRENSGSVGPASARRCLAGTLSEAEVSFGENILEIDARDGWV